MKPTGFSQMLCRFARLRCALGSRWTICVYADCLNCKLDAQLCDCEPFVRLDVLVLFSDTAPISSRMHLFVLWFLVVQRTTPPVFVCAQHSYSLPFFIYTHRYCCMLLIYLITLRKRFRFMCMYSVQ